MDQALLVVATRSHEVDDVADLVVVLRAAEVSRVVADLHVLLALHLAGQRVRAVAVAVGVRDALHVLHHFHAVRGCPLGPQLCRRGFRRGGEKSLGDSRVARS